MKGKKPPSMFHSITQKSKNMKKLLTCNKTSSRGDSDETGDHALNSTNDGRLAEINKIHAYE